MKRGTTPTHTFTLPFDTSIIRNVRVIYAQSDEPVLIKSVGECALHENVITVQLSQEDTLLFDCTKPLQIQVRILLEDGTVINSDIILRSVLRCLESEVIV